MKQTDHDTGPRPPIDQPPPPPKEPPGDSTSGGGTREPGVTVPVLSTNKLTAQAIADTMLNPPEASTSEAVKYAEKATIACLAVGVKQTVTTTDGTKCSMLRELFLARIDEIFDFLIRAKNSDLNIPNNPIIVLSHENANRKLFTIIGKTEAECTALIGDLNKIVKLFNDEKEGKLKLKENPLEDYAQISSFAIGAEGMTGNQSVNDLNGFVLNADKFKLNRALEALSTLDFSKRIPRVLFTCDYSPDNVTSEGAIIGWKKIHDASGYVIKRHDVFRNVDTDFTITNDELFKQKNSQVTDYIDKWVLSFYDHDKKSVCTWLDKSIKRDSFYTYRVVAYQDIATDKNSLFNVERIPATISQSILKEIELSIFNPAQVMLSAAVIGQVLKIDEPLKLNDYSPYPAISKKLYGDVQYDWLLAAINMTAAFERKETAEKIRSYSYLGSSFSFISNEITAGRFFLPKNVSDMKAKIEEAILHFGVTKTLVKILDATGMLFFFGDKDVNSDKFDAGVSTETGILAAILSTIDPETATVNPKTLLSNLSAQSQSVMAMQAVFFDTGKVKDIQIDQKTDHSTDNTFADTAVQFIDNSSVNQELMDLTTYEGIGRFVQAIRAYFDANQKRGK